MVVGVMIVESETVRVRRERANVERQKQSGNFLNFETDFIGFVGIFTKKKKLKSRANLYLLRLITKSVMKDNILVHNIEVSSGYFPIDFCAHFSITSSANP